MIINDRFNDYSYLWDGTEEGWGLAGDEGRYVFYNKKNNLILMSELSDEEFNELVSIFLEKNGTIHGKFPDCMKQ